MQCTTMKTPSKSIVQSIELATLKLVQAGMPVKKVMKRCKRILKNIRTKTFRLNSLKRQNGIIPHAKRRNRANSYIAVPFELRQRRVRLEKLLRRQEQKEKTRITIRKGCNGIIPHARWWFNRRMMMKEKGSRMEKINQDLVYQKL